MAKKEIKGEVVKQTVPKKEEEKKEEKVDGSEAFIEAIKNHLRAYVKKDPLFLAKLKNPKKNIQDCMTFIMNQAMKNAKNGVMGYADSDVYKLARHYYDEENIEVGKPITNAAIAVNQQITLSEEEVEKAKQEGRERVISEEMSRMRKKPAPKKDTNITKAAELIQKKENEEEQTEDASGQASLF